MTANTRGRPEFQPTLDQRQTVEEMRFVGEDAKTIARAIGVDPRTLAKAFREELANGHANRRREVVGLLFQQARQGNTAATKHLEALGRLAGTGEAAKRPAKPSERIGKKQAADAAAQAVSGKYEPMKAPLKLVKS